MYPDNKENCNICEGSTFKKISDRVREADTWKIYQCLSCGHIQLFPRPTIEDDKKFYDTDSQEKSIRQKVDVKNLQDSFTTDTLRRADLISSKFQRSLSILDIGCGYGFFVEELSRRGYPVKGIEISRERKELAKQVTHSQILDINLAVNSSKITLEKQDIITLFHVLEHMADPVSFCKNVKEFLKPNSCFIVEVPNVEELLLETCPAYNSFYWNRPHLNYFSHKSLRMVLERVGFTKINLLFVQRYGVENLCNWLQNGKPQLEKPILAISSKYRWLEDYYRDYLANQGRTDTLIALAYNSL